MESEEDVASQWGSQAAIFARRLMQPLPTAPSSRPLSEPIGMLTQLAETGIRVILAGETMEDDPKMESRIPLGVIASQGRFEYLERSGGGEGSVPSRQGWLPGSRTAAEPSWSMLAADSGCTSIATEATHVVLLIRLCLPAYPFCSHGL